jgi:flavodoxin
MTVYYFSGMGNSLAVARDIAAKTGAELVPAASVIDRHVVEIEDEKIDEQIFERHKKGMAQDSGL